MDCGPLRSGAGRVRWRRPGSRSAAGCSGRSQASAAAVPRWGWAVWWCRSRCPCRCHRPPRGLAGGRRADPDAGADEEADAGAGGSGAGAGGDGGPPSLCRAGRQGRNRKRTPTRGRGRGRRRGRGRCWCCCRCRCHSRCCYGYGYCGLVPGVASARRRHVAGVLILIPIPVRKHWCGCPASRAR